MIITFSLLVILISSVKGAGSNDIMVSLSPQSDSLTLIYNNVSAANFPHIVSLVTVMNGAGFIVGKLDTNNFEVYEDGVREFPIDVVELPSAESDINVVLVIDRSWSMEGQPIKDAKAAATMFVELMQSKDKSAIVSFSSSPRIDSPLSSDRDLLKTVISNIIAKGQTAVYDALINSISLLSDDLQNRAIILLTDGEDNSSKYTYPEALSECLAHEIRVFTIGLALKMDGPEEKILKDLANKTGGLYFRSPTSSDLEEIYKAISQILHHRYQVSYTTHNPAKDGTLRHVNIDVFVHHNTSADTASYRAPYEEPPPPPPPQPPADDPKPPEPPPDPRPPIEPVVEDMFEVMPNPFTPNEDGFNDKVEFRKGNGIPRGWVILIMDRTGKIIKRMANGERFWDGKNQGGILMLPGSYLFLVSNGKRVLHRGVIELIR